MSRTGRRLGAAVLLLALAGCGGSNSDSSGAWSQQEVDAENEANANQVPTPRPSRTTDPSFAFTQGQMQGRSSVTQSNASFFCTSSASRFKGDPNAYSAFLQGCLNPYS